MRRLTDWQTLRRRTFTVIRLRRAANENRKTPTWLCVDCWAPVADETILSTVQYSRAPVSSLTIAMPISPCVCAHRVECNIQMTRARSLKDQRLRLPGVDSGVGFGGLPPRDLEIAVYSSAAYAGCVLTTQGSCIFNPPPMGERSIVMSVSLSVCLFVCLYVRERISGTTCPILTKFCACYGHGSMLLWRRSDTLCTSG